MSKRLTEEELAMYGNHVCPKKNNDTAFIYSCNFCDLLSHITISDEEVHALKSDYKILWDATHTEYQVLVDEKIALKATVNQIRKAARNVYNKHILLHPQCHRDDCLIHALQQACTDCPDCGGWGTVSTTEPVSVLREDCKTCKGWFDAIP